LSGRVLLVSLLSLSGCTDSLLVAEQSKELDSSDGGSHQDAAPPPVDTPDAVPPVVTICGNALCENRVANVAGTVIVGYACCVNPHLSICGLVQFGSTCRELDQPGKLDPTCDLPLGDPLGTHPGCCRPDKTCGVFESDLGLGCTEVPVWTAIKGCKYE
jgi:hypothetical protein